MSIKSYIIYGCFFNLCTCTCITNIELNFNHIYFQKYFKVHLIYYFVFNRNKKIKLSKSFTKPNFFYIGHASCNRNSYAEDHTNDEHRLPMQQNHSLEFKSTEKGTYSQQGTVYGM